MRKPFASKLASFGLAAAMAVSMCSPIAAYADDTTNENSLVTIQYIQTATGDEGFPLEDTIGVTVPSTIPLAYRSDGSLVGPTHRAYRIQNTSIKDIYLDSNALFAIGSDDAFGQNGQHVAINGAARSAWPSVNLTMGLKFDRGDVEATTHDPRTTVSVDGQNMTSLQAGHGVDSEGNLLSVNKVQVPVKGSTGCDFIVSATNINDSDPQALTKFLDAFQNGAARIGSLTWSFVL